MRCCASCTAARRRGEPSRPLARGRCGSGPPTPATPGSLPPAASPAPIRATAPATTGPTSTPPTAIPVTRPPLRSWAPRPTSTAGCGTAPNTRPSPPPATPRSSPASSPPSPPASTDQGRSHPRRPTYHAPQDPASLRRAVAAPTRGLEDEQVTGTDRHRVTTGHGHDGPVRPLDPVPPQRPGQAARHPVRRHPPVTGQGRHRHRLAEPDLPVAPVATAPAARAPAAPPDRVPLQSHRVPPLQHLGIGEPGVGHVRLHHVRARETVSRPRPARHRLVVLVPLVAERDVVHRARALGLHPQRRVQGAGDDLR